jgi:hypothetical protein
MFFAGQQKNTLPFYDASVFGNECVQATAFI